MQSEEKWNCGFCRYLWLVVDALAMGEQLGSREET